MNFAATNISPDSIHIEHGNFAEQLLVDPGTKALKNLNI